MHCVAKVAIWGGLTILDGVLVFSPSSSWIRAAWFMIETFGLHLDY